MGNDDKKKPRLRPDIDASRIKKQGSGDDDKPDKKNISERIISELDHSRYFREIDDSAELYKEALRRAPGFPWSHDQEEAVVVPDLLAPFLSGADPDRITPKQIVDGVYINIPQSSELSTGDHIKIVWGYNTFYTTLKAQPDEDGPRLIQYINSEQLPDYTNGKILVHYEVIRGYRLIGVSKQLIINLEGNGRPRSGQRRKYIRRKR